MNLRLFLTFLLLLNFSTGYIKSDDNLNTEAPNLNLPKPPIEPLPPVISPRYKPYPQIKNSISITGTMMHLEPLDIWCIKGNNGIFYIPRNINNGFEILKQENLKVKIQASKNLGETNKQVININILSAEYECSQGNIHTIKPKIKDTFLITGTLEYINLEGGFWAIKANDGNYYLPLNLDKFIDLQKYHYFTAEVKKENIITNKMFGTPITMLRIVTSPEETCFSNNRETILK